MQPPNPQETTDLYGFKLPVEYNPQLRTDIDRIDIDTLRQEAEARSQETQGKFGEFVIDGATAPRREVTPAFEARVNSPVYDIVRLSSAAVELRRLVEAIGEIPPAASTLHTVDALRMRAAAGNHNTERDGYNLAA